MDALPVQFRGDMSFSKDVPTFQKHQADQSIFSVLFKSDLEIPRAEHYLVNNRKTWENHGKMEVYPLVMTHITKKKDPPFLVGKYESTISTGPFSSIFHSYVN